MTPFVVLAINLVGLVVVWVILRSYVRRQTRQDAVLEDIKREAGAIVTELNSTTERNIELIEARIQELSELIATADRRIGTLRKETAVDRSSERTYARLGAGRPLRLTLEEDSADAAAASTVMTNDDATLAPTPSAPAGPVDVRTRVRSLHERGMAVKEIATTVGKTVGEVELIISLASPRRP